MNNPVSLVEGTIIGEITVAEASEMVAAYNGSFLKTKSVWFCLKQMDQLVTLLKAEKLLGMDTDGVRVYFGTYTEGTIGTQPRSNIGMDTVIFVSTKAFKDSTGTVLFHEDYFEHLELPKHALPENRGELCQPNCNGAKLP